MHSGSLISCNAVTRGPHRVSDIKLWKEGHMFLILALVLFVAWIGGFVMFKSAGLLIHLLLIFAVISIVMHFITGRRAV